jgi:hypothetical protein
MFNPGALVAGLLAVLLSACGPTVVYECTAPESADGRVCVAQSNNQRSFCIQADQHAVAQCQSNRNSMMNNYQQCMNAGGKNCTFPPPVRASIPGIVKKPTGAVSPHAADTSHRTG